MYEYKAKLLKVIDGDTIDAEIDLGFDIYIKKRVRLAYINSPEIRTTDLEEKKRGKLAKSFLKKIFKESGSDFVLKSYGFGKFGRCLGEIFINNKSVNDILISEGYATKY